MIILQCLIDARQRKRNRTENENKKGPAKLRNIQLSYSVVNNTGEPTGFNLPWTHLYFTHRSKVPSFNLVVVFFFFTGLSQRRLLS